MATLFPLFPRPALVHPGIAMQPTTRAAGRRPYRVRPILLIPLRHVATTAVRSPCCRRVVHSGDGTYYRGECKLAMSASVLRIRSSGLAVKSHPSCSGPRFSGIWIKCQTSSGTLQPSQKLDWMLSHRWEAPIGTWTGMLRAFFIMGPFGPADSRALEPALRR